MAPISFAGAPFAQAQDEKLSKEEEAALTESLIGERILLMKTLGFSAKASGDMVRGRLPYDPVKAEMAMRAIHAVAGGFVNNFSPDAKGTNKESTASPKIWESFDDFIGRAADLGEAAKEAMVESRKGAEQFKVAFGKLVKHCKTCHELYRVKK